MTLAALVLLAQLSAHDCRDIAGNRYVVGQIPWFSCYERQADCSIKWVHCNAREVLAAAGLGFQLVEPPTPTRPNTRRVTR